MYTYSSAFSFFIFLLCCLTSCKNHTVKPNMLNGYWVLESATREAQPTTTLDGTWVAFEASKKAISSNLPLGLTGNETYQIVESQIHLATQPPVIFDVTAMTDSTMSLAFQARGFTFTLEMRKTDRPKDEPVILQPVEQ
jgi:hypothetical protein